MFRRVLVASMTSWLLFSCDGDDDPATQSGGKGGANQGGSKASGGTAGRGGSGGTAGRGGSGGTAARGGSGGTTIAEGGAGADAGAGGMTDPGSGGAPAAGAGGEGPASGGTSSGGTTTGGTTTGGTTTGGTTTGGGGTTAVTGGTTGSGGTTGGTTTTGTGGDSTIEGGSAGQGGEAGALGGAGGEAGAQPLGLVVHYPFNENTGTTAADATGHFPVATLAGAASWASGRAGTSAVELAATTAHVVLPNGLFATAEKATIAAWVNLTAYNPWSRIWDINAGLSKFVYLASDRGANPGDGPFFAIHTGVPAEDGIVSTPGDLPLGVWKHVAVVIDGTTYRLFVDGYPTATALTNPRFPKEIEPSTAGWLGRSTFAADAYLKAKLDDFRVYDHVLTQPEIADLAWPDNDYSYLRLDETSGTTVADSSARNFDGTLVNGPTFAPGKVNGGVQLTSSADQYIALPPSVIAECDDLTIAMWAKLGAVPYNTRLLDIDGLLNGFLFLTPTAEVPNTGVAGTHPELRFNIFRSGQVPADQTVSAPYPTGTILVDNWHHFAVTLSGGTARAYFDGVQIGSNAMTFKPSDVDIATTGAHAWIGRSTFFSADPELDAVLDDVRISCRAYTADEIRQLAR